jgi:nitroreductase
MFDLAESLPDRWSPLAWDSSHRITRPEVERLLEAARWSPSAGNSQPLSFVIACRDDELHQLLVPLLAASSGRWAPQAALLVVNVCHRYVEGTHLGLVRVRGVRPGPVGRAYDASGTLDGAVGPPVPCVRS